MVRKISAKKWIFFLLFLVVFAFLSLSKKSGFFFDGAEKKNTGRGDVADYQGIKSEDIDINEALGRKAKVIKKDSSKLVLPDALISPELEVLEEDFIFQQEQGVVSTETEVSEVTPQNLLDLEGDFRKNEALGLNAQAAKVKNSDMTPQKLLDLEAAFRKNEALGLNTQAKVKASDVTPQELLELEAAFRKHETEGLNDQTEVEASDVTPQELLGLESNFRTDEVARD